MLGTALYEAGATVEAERQFRGLLERQPASGPARLALAEALLSQGRYAEAAQEAGAVEGVFHAAAALRTQATSRLLAGDLDGVSRMLDGKVEEDADTASLLAGDRALFGAWLALARGEDPPASLPPGCAGLLTVVLEALLRLVEVDAFALLVGLLDRVGMPWRERREVLATMYLRRGFLESAGDEWIDVCTDAGPDVAALIGLAQVAYARGHEQDARVFAAEACALEPGHEVAQRLAARLGVAGENNVTPDAQVLLAPADQWG
jgi:tetratricopeptide (TPR) repeat protein